MADYKSNRPIALSLVRFHFPVTAIASITHRFTGMVLVAALLPMLWLLDMSLQSADGFHRVGEMLREPLPAIAWAAVVASYSYHLLAGIRHLLMDMGIGEELRSGRISAMLVLALGALCFVLMLVSLLI